MNRSNINRTKLNSSNKCCVIGVLDNAMSGLPEAYQQKIQQADLIVAATRTINLFKNNFKKEAAIFDLTAKFIESVDVIKSALKTEQQVIVLATGDPLCHGIGAFLVKKMGKDTIDILPNQSMVQVAFSHLGESWQDAKICSIHGADTKEWQIGSTPEHKLYTLLNNIKFNHLLAIYTSESNSPERIARMLIMENMAKDFEFSIFEKLLQKEQKVTLNIDTKTVSKGKYASPNLVVLKRKSKLNNPLLFGYDDNFYAMRKPEKGLITRADIRAVVLAKMQLKQNSIVWDIGAGSGSVGLEAAQLCQQGHIFAIEKNCDDLPLIEKNRQQMGLINYSIICGKAPEIIDNWPSPNAVFIGGSSGNLENLIKLVLDKLTIGSSLVMNFITLENLTHCLEILKSISLDWNLTQMQSSHSKPILHMNRLQADNLVWIVSTIKK
ncbi:MAG: precorrin-6y C5,15-methyltransferase (decarboxylating) subunit CbiE [Pseudomonadota bacterium]